jgi:hypothetical protein
MSINIILKLKIVRVRTNQLLAIRFVNSFDSVKHVLSHVFITVLLEHVSRESLLIVRHHMDEVTELTAGAALWSVVVLARNSSIVSNVDQSLFTWSLRLVADHLLLF